MTARPKKYVKCETCGRVFRSSAKAPQCTNLLCRSTLIRDATPEEIEESQKTPDLHLDSGQGMQTEEETGFRSVQISTDQEEIKKDDEKTDDLHFDSGQDMQTEEETGFRSVQISTDQEEIKKDDEKTDDLHFDSGQDMQTEEEPGFRSVQISTDQEESTKPLKAGGLSPIIVIGGFFVLAVIAACGWFLSGRGKRKQSENIGKPETNNQTELSPLINQIQKANGRRIY